MKSMMKKLGLVAIGALAGAAGIWTAGNGLNVAAQTESGERQPLYWVAPMDPNYKRDKPGKSPMGMDLIPVYEESAAGDTPGTVRISSDVINNLGVRTTRVERGAIETEIQTVGYVQYDEDELAHIHPRVEGWIERLYVKAEGDPVAKGTPLYAIYSPTLVNAQEELVLALKRNNPRLVRAAQDRLAALQLPRPVIEELKRSRKVRQNITFYAPRSGVLDNLDVREGMFVKPGMRMMSIGVLEQIWVVGEVFERQAALISAGDEVRMRLDYLPGREWNGSIDYVYPSLNSETRTARIRTRFTNADGVLKPGMFAQLVISPRRSGETLFVPREALIRTGGQSRVVMALGEGKYKSVEVTVGRISDRQVEILSGLEEGERIVTSAQFLLDSESSKSSDFKRMDSVTEIAPETMQSMDHSRHQGMGSDSMPEMDHGRRQGMDADSMPGMDHSQHQGMDAENMPEMDHGQHQGMNESMPAMDHTQHQGMNMKTSEQEGS